MRECRCLEDKKCNPCQSREWREKYPEKFKNLRKNFREKSKALVQELKKDKPCTDCGYVYVPFVMDFDHLEDKHFELSSCSQNSRSERKIRAEAAKCEIVCSNCHRLRTFKRNPIKDNREEIENILGKLLERRGQKTMTKSFLEMVGTAIDKIGRKNYTKE